MVAAITLGTLPNALQYPIKHRFLYCFFYQYLGFSIGLLSVSLLVSFTCVLFTCLCQKIQNTYVYIGEERNIVSDSCRNFCCSNCFVGNLCPCGPSPDGPPGSGYTAFFRPPPLYQPPLSLSLSLAFSE